METLFSFLFKYRPFYFRQGEFTFQWALEWWLVLLMLAGFSGFLFLLYRRGAFTGRQRFWLVSLRLMAFSLLLVLFMRPSLVLSTLVPRENLLGILVDNSRSMGLPEQDQPRGARVLPLLEPDSDFIQDLEARFFVRPFRFDAAAESLELPANLDWQGDQTNIPAALQRILNETRNLPLAGIVLFSDGADNSFRDFREVMAELTARQIPVHTVGVGPERLQQDVEVSQVSAPRTLLPKSLAGVRITVRHSGFGGSRARLEVREGSVLVQSEEVYLPREQESVVVETTISPKQEGLKLYDFRILPLEGETIVENNARRVLVQVADTRPKILYVEGHPRWEYKFLRRALAEDKNLRLESLLRTAPNKFYRQGIEEESTLAAGFPNDPEELFQYQGLIFGSIESAFFEYGQMEMVRDFVGKRGGGFLMLGGASSYAGGKYLNTPIEQILPFRLNLPDDDDYAQGEGRFEATAYGERHPALQLGVASKSSRQAWADMPKLSDWNPVGSAKPGATVLAALQVEDGSRKNQPLLAFQRFGRGHAVALLTGSSWRWQMQLGSEDERHETFWRQLLRWLISLSKDPVSVETERETYSRHEPVAIRAEVNDKAFNRLNDAQVEASVETPSGRTESFPLRWSVREDGVYEGEFAPEEDGLYKVSVKAGKRAGGPAESYGEGSSAFLTETGTREYFEPAQRRDFLERLAKETGGRYYTLQEASKIPEEIVYTESRASRVEVLDLWDMPVNLMLLIGLLCGEWFARRRFGVI